MRIQRVARLRNELARLHTDGLFMTNPYSISYITGFTPLSPSEREAFMLITQDETYIFSDARYTWDNIPGREVRILDYKNNLLKQLQDIIQKNNLQSVAFEPENMTWAEYNSFKTHLSVSFIPTANLVMQLRSVKETEEEDCIRYACQVGDRSLQKLIPYIKPGKTEKEIAFKLELIIRQSGCDLAFDPIVAVDRNSAVPHYHTKNGNGKIKNTSLILIDFGVKYKGYCSDMTRMFFTGSVSHEQKKAYDVLLTAQKKAVSLVYTTNKGQFVDQECRKVLANSAFPEYAHSTGHGVGLEIHEFPKLSSASKDILASGNIVTVEPGIYFNEKWGMRIEDTVLCKSLHHNEVLTRFLKEPILI